MRYRKFGAFSSSTDPDKLATTVQGLIMGFGTLVIFIAAQFGITIIGEELNTVAVQIGTIATALMTVFGLCRKVFVWITEKWATREE